MLTLAKTANRSTSVLVLAAIVPAGIVPAGIVPAGGCIGLRSWVAITRWVALTHWVAFTHWVAAGVARDEWHKCSVEGR